MLHRWVDVLCVVVAIQRCVSSTSSESELTDHHGPRCRTSSSTGLRSQLGALRSGRGEPRRGVRTRFSSKQIGRQADDGSICGALRPNGRPDVGILCATAAGDRAELCAATGSARRRKFARGCGWRAVVEARRRWRLRAWTHKGRERQFLKARYRPQGIHTAWAPAKSREGAGEGAHLALRRQLFLFVKPGERERPPSRSGEETVSAAHATSSHAAFPRPSLGATITSFSPSPTTSAVVASCFLPSSWTPTET